VNFRPVVTISRRTNLLASRMALSADINNAVQDVINTEKEHLIINASKTEDKQFPQQRNSHEKSSLPTHLIRDGENVSNKRLPDEGKKTSVIRTISSCALYCFCSVSMVLVNKSLASSYNGFLETGSNLNFFLVVFQAVVAVVAVQFCKVMNWVEYPSFNVKTAIEWAPVNLFFCAMLFTGMASLQYNSVPMVTVFKNIANIGIAIGDFYWFGNKVGRLVVVAFGVMLGGALLAAKNDREVSGIALFWMVANCLTTAGYVLYMKFATKNVKLSKFGMVFYNNVLCVVFLLPVTLANGEMNTFLKTRAIHTVDYLAKNSFAGFIGFFLNFASLNCVENTGPTTYAIVGSMNKIPTAILGWFLFDSVISPQGWVFMSLSMFGGFLYSYAKISGNMKVDEKK